MKQQRQPLWKKNGNFTLTNNGFAVIRVLAYSKLATVNSRVELIIEHLKMWRLTKLFKTFFLNQTTLLSSWFLKVENGRANHTTGNGTYTKKVGITCWQDLSANISMNLAIICLSVRMPKRVSGLTLLLIWLSVCAWQLSSLHTFVHNVKMLPKNLFWFVNQGHVIKWP